MNNLMFNVYYLSEQILNCFILIDILYFQNYFEWKLYKILHIFELDCV